MKALPTITQIIKSGQYNDLAGLFTSRAKDALIKDIETNWTEVQKNNIEVRNEDIKATQMEKIFWHKVGYDTYADIDVMFDVIREDIDPPMKIKMMLTFSRKYTKHGFHDWTVISLKIVSFGY